MKQNQICRRLEKLEKRVENSNIIKNYGIKKCPFCGGTATIRGSVRAFVRCDKCKARGMSFPYIKDDSITKEKAIISCVNAWNRRYVDETIPM